ncbi:MAG TPA: DUF3426 domain-containing protein [Methylophilaceae bacterium]|nr:DUF3426 domain-containing protein [Methylophilaceae bacterium]
MSLVTACPACASNFRIQPEQLGAHQGQVRCGKCSHVFNALDRLAELSETTAQPIEESSADKPSVFAYTIVDKEIPPSPATVADAARKDKLDPHNRQVFRQLLGWSLIMLLVLLAALQATYYLRTPITARWPASKPYLLQACELLHCKIALPQQIELLTIDDSDLQEDAEYQGLMHFSSTIINNAQFAQAYPLLELTLTDTADQPLLRKIFPPSEYLPAGANLKQGITAGEEVRVRLNLTIKDTAVAGYRVFITYPKSH